jgi:hypothetical protein
MWLWWYWPVALAFLALVMFAIPEFLAIKQGKGATFSEFMAYMARQSKFGVIWTFLWGALIGGLLVHFSGWCVGPCL